MKLDPRSTDRGWVFLPNGAPWVSSSHGWGQPDDRRSSSPQDAQQRPKRQKPSDRLRRSSPSVVFPDGRRSVQEEQQQPQQQQQPHQYPDQADDFVYKMMTNAHGSLELYCVTCEAWLGDDPPKSAHFFGRGHRSWEAHFIKQKNIKNAMGGSVGTPSRPLAGPPQRAPFVFGRGPSEAETPALVTHDDLPMLFDKHVIDKLERQSAQMAAQQHVIDKLERQSAQQQHVIDKLERQSAQMAAQMHDVRHTMLEMQLEMSRMHEFLSRELA
jgi:uncharacterized coiled-coil protein SlyX